MTSAITKSVSFVDESPSHSTPTKGCWHCLTDIYKAFIELLVRISACFCRCFNREVSDEVTISPGPINSSDSTGAVLLPQSMMTSPAPDHSLATETGIHPVLDPPTVCPMQSVEEGNKPETIKPYFSLRCGKVRRYGSVWYSSGFRKKAEIYPHDPFIKALSEEILTKNPSFTTKFLTQREYDLDTREPYENLRYVAVPADQTLLKIAEKYKKKYQTTILITNELDRLWTQLSGYSENYIGIIVTTSLSSHVVPLLLWQSPKTQEKHVLILDVDPRLEKSYGVKEKLKTMGIPNSAIYSYTGPVRQADEYSCRIGALTLLRNALLSLRHHEIAGFDQLSQLKGYRAYSNEVSELPFEWIYQEQISPKFQKGDPNAKLFKMAIAIRDRYSKKVHKRTSPRTVQTHRKENQVTLYQVEMFDIEELTENHSLFTLPPPKDFRVYRKGNTLTVEMWKQSKKVHIGLRAKGFKESGEKLYPI